MYIFFWRYRISQRNSQMVKPTICNQSKRMCLKFINQNYHPKRYTGKNLKALETIVSKPDFCAVNWPIKFLGQISSCGSAYFRLRGCVNKLNYRI